MAQCIKRLPHDHDELSSDQHNPYNCGVVVVAWLQYQYWRQEIPGASWLARLTVSVLGSIEKSCISVWGRGDT